MNLRRCERTVTSSAVNVLVLLPMRILVMVCSGLVAGLVVRMRDLFVRAGRCSRSMSVRISRGRVSEWRRVVRMRWFMWKLSNVVRVQDGLSIASRRSNAIMAKLSGLILGVRRRG